MAKYTYPAIFTKEDNGMYSIIFPDIESCITQGNSLEDGLAMASDALCLILYDLEEKGEFIPSPSEPLDIKAAKNSFISLISCDTLEYRKFFDSKSIKKTLTIPSWLNTMAEKEKINFSATLQSALKEQLNIDNKM